MTAAKPPKRFEVSVVNLECARFHDVNLSNARFEDVNISGTAITSFNGTGLTFND
jgi:uncharacterized protein YjbI with pentapeptide repeats